MNARITQKTDAVALDANTKKSVEQKKEKLFQALQSIDNALKNHDRTRLREQATFFREGYKETLAYIQSGAISSGVTHKNIPKTV